MNRKPSFDGIVAALNHLSDEEKCALVDKPQALKEFAGKLVTEMVSNIHHLTPLSDKDLAECLQSVAVKWHRLAAKLGYTGPVAWRVRAGFTLKHHAPQAGPCFDNFNYLQDWKLKNDEPTEESIVFWIPRLVSKSTSKTVAEQMTLLKSLRKRLKLPDHHLTSFGSAALISGLILAHFKRIGERTPPNCYWVRTDILHACGYRLNLGRFDEYGLRCYDWYWDGYRSSGLGCFPLGVELGS